MAVSSFIFLSDNCTFTYMTRLHNKNIIPFQYVLRVLCTKILCDVIDGIISDFSSMDICSLQIAYTMLLISEIWYNNY